VHEQQLLADDMRLLVVRPAERGADRWGVGMCDPDILPRADIDRIVKHKMSGIAHVQRDAERLGRGHLWIGSQHDIHVLLWRRE